MLDARTSAGERVGDGAMQAPIQSDSTRSQAASSEKHSVGIPTPVLRTHGAEAALIQGGGVPLGHASRQRLG